MPIEKRSNPNRASTFDLTNNRTARHHPFVRVVTADMARKMGLDKETMKYFYDLFPKNIHQAFQVTALPMQEFFL